MKKKKAMFECQISLYAGGASDPTINLLPALYIARRKHHWAIHFHFLTLLVGIAIARSGYYFEVYEDGFVTRPHN